MRLTWNGPVPDRLHDFLRSIAEAGYSVRVNDLDVTLCGYSGGILCGVIETGAGWAIPASDIKQLHIYGGE